jgi:peptidyl-prolyl cis-trans isomerase C
MSYMNRIPGWLITIGITLLASTITVSAADPVITEKKAADINGVSITMLSLNNEYRQVLKQQGITDDQMTPDQVAEYKKQLLDSLINQELLYQECQKNNIAASEDSVNTSLEKALASFENEDEYRNALKDANMQEGDLETRIRRALAINMLVDEKVGQFVVVTDEDVRAYYDSHPDSFQRSEKVRASHILVKTDRDADEAEKAAALEKLENIRKKVKAGEDFAQLARENSDCPSNENGGELGYFERGKMVQEFEEAAFALETGDVSGIVQTDFGFHLIKVTDKIKADTISYETVKSDLEDFIKRQKISTGVASLIETLRKEAEIETYL